MKLPWMTHAVVILSLCLAIADCSVQLRGLDQSTDESGFLFLTRTKTQPPFWISLHRPKDDTPRATIMDTQMYYEAGKTAMMMRYLSQNPGILLDVGANIGWYSLAAAAVGSIAVAIEPNPANMARIKQSVRANHFEDSIIGMNLGAGAKATTLHFVQVATNMGMGHFIAPGQKAPPSAKEIPVRRVDDVVKGLFTFGRLPSNLPVRCVKIDVEGFEAYAVQGLMSTLHDHRPLIFMEFDNNPPTPEYLQTMHAVLALGYTLQEGSTNLAPTTSLSEFSSWFNSRVVKSTHPVDIIFHQAEHQI